MNKMLSVSLLAACVASSNNMWLARWDTPYGIPPFKELEVSKYVDAVKTALELKNGRIAAIVANKEKPTFENTIVPFIYSGDELRRLSAPFRFLFSLERDSAREKANLEADPLLVENDAKINSDKALFDRVDAVYRAPRGNLSDADITVLERIYRGFRRGGMALSPEKRQRLLEIQKRMRILSLEFSKNNLAANNAFREKFGISVSAYTEAVSTTADRAKREAMYRQYTSRGACDGPHDNRPVILEIAALRIEAAELLGYKSPADFYNEVRMPENAATALDFTLSVIKPAVACARREIGRIEELFMRDVAAGLLPAGAKLEAWDLLYYMAKLKNETFDFSEDRLKPYFKASRVLEGVFLQAEKLYGIKARRLTDVPEYNPGMSQAYEITESDGAHIGVLIVDYVPRPSKASGAWMSMLRSQWQTPDGTDVRPIVINACNFDEYLVPGKVRTAFHEYGHALHTLLSKCRYPVISCTSSTSDYNEIFSQINERRAFSPQLLKHYARNDKGEVLPQELVTKMNDARRHCPGIRALRLAMPALVDLKWHLLDGVEGVDPVEFERRVFEEAGIPHQIPPLHRLTHFSHIFSGKYAAGYYSYLWAEVLDAHLYSVFEESGDIWNRELSEKFRKTFLEKGSSVEPMKLFKAFTGEDKPDPSAFFRYRGLVEPGKIR